MIRASLHGGIVIMSDDGDNLPMRSQHPNQRGLVVLVSFLSPAILCCQCSSQDEDAPQKWTLSAMNTLAGDLETIGSAEPDFRPRDFDDLYKLLRERGVIPKGPKFREDTWGHPYLLLRGSRQGSNLVYTLVSAGPDGVMNTQDDLKVVALVRNTGPASRPDAATGPEEGADNGTGSFYRP
jgi:hypothetical protein